VPWTGYTSSTEKAIVITDAEFAGIIADNLPDDVAGVEADIQALVNSRSLDAYSIKITVASTDPLTFSGDCPFYHG
jgi:hypothetical protein